MSEKVAESESNIDDLYEDYGHWHVNTGDQIIHAKRVKGRFRSLKWLAASLWLSFFIGPYFRWEGNQAILFDIPNRKFHFLELTILPQDVWMLSLILLFMAILLMVVTTIAGRVFCGYFCFQTIWTDIFTLIEEKIDGNPAQRRKLDAAPMDGRKLRLRATKYGIWLLISMLTGVSFAAWFTDSYQLWHDLFTLNADITAWVVLGMFTAGTFILAGFMREQVCFWLCPYARIQGVMYDKETILPTYDEKRGEPRGKLVKGETESNNGDCIACNQCVAVCPTGIDIREGQQEGCITCAMCIDACDHVMDKINKPRGLIRYASLDEMEGQPTIKIYKRPRVIVYLVILTLAVSGILYGLTHLGTLEMSIIHERQPLFVQQSDGTIQNKYYLKVLNKTDEDVSVRIAVEGSEGLIAIGIDDLLLLEAGEVTNHTVFVKIPEGNLEDSVTPVYFKVYSEDDDDHDASYKSMFTGPRK